MNISIQQLLSKMDEELKKARGASTEARMREKIYSIKTMCDLILEESTPERTASFQRPAVQKVETTGQLTIQQSKKLEMENEANGDSLFDF